MITDSLPKTNQWSPVGIIRRNQREIQRQPDSQLQLRKERLSSSAAAGRFPHASDCAATVTTTLATVICPVTNPDNNFASCLLFSPFHMSPVSFCHASTGSLCRVFSSLCNVHLFSLFPLTKPQGETLGRKRFSVTKKLNSIGAAQMRSLTQVDGFYHTFCSTSSSPLFYSYGLVKNKNL